VSQIAHKYCLARLIGGPPPSLLDPFPKLSSAKDPGVGLARPHEIFINILQTVKWAMCRRQLTPRKGIRRGWQVMNE